MEGQFERDWALAFLRTLALELPVYAMLLRKTLGVPRACLLALGVNLLTHPALWFLMPWFRPWWLWLLVGEVAVWATEALLTAGALGFRPSPGRAMVRAALVSACANGVSAAAGLLF